MRRALTAYSKLERDPEPLAEGPGPGWTVLRNARGVVRVTILLALMV